MKYLFIIFSFILFSTELFGQSIFAGRQYLGEGIPIRWFQLETDSTGFYYSKGDVGYTELSKTPLTWNQSDSKSIHLTIHYKDSPEILELTTDSLNNYFRDSDGFEIFHRKLQITVDGKTFKE